MADKNSFVWNDDGSLKATLGDIAHADFKISGQHKPGEITKVQFGWARIHILYCREAKIDKCPPRPFRRMDV